MFNSGTILMGLQNSWKFNLFLWATRGCWLQHTRGCRSFGPVILNLSHTLEHPKILLSCKSLESNIRAQEPEHFVLTCVLSKEKYTSHKYVTKKFHKLNPQNQHLNIETEHYWHWKPFSHPYVWKPSHYPTKLTAAFTFNTTDEFCLLLNFLLDEIIPHVPFLLSSFPQYCLWGSCIMYVAIVCVFYWCLVFHCMTRPQFIIYSFCFHWWFCSRYYES